MKVFRTWGFNDKNVTTIEGGLPDYGGEGAGGTEIVFQWWEDGKPTINIEAFDKVVAAAETTGIKLIVALTNNWADYGGMDVYTVNLGGQYHDDVRQVLFHAFLGLRNANGMKSSIAFPKSRMHSRPMLRSSSPATVTRPSSWRGSLPTSHAALLMRYGT